MQRIYMVVLPAIAAAAACAAKSDDDLLCTQEKNEAEMALQMSASFIEVRRDAEHKDTWLSRRDSLGFISENVKAWRKRKQIHREQMKRERENPFLGGNCGEGMGHIWFQDHYEPSFHCEFEERIGQMGDGGKWVCDPERIRKRVKSGNDKCLIYSVGSNGDFSFEESVLAQISHKCEVHTFDPMKAGVWKAPEGVQYHSVALGMDAPAKPLAQIVKELGHSGRKIDLFKIDCEGCEWDTFKSWFGSGVDIRQILVELHWRANPEKAHELFEFLFKQGYVIFNKEPNTLGCSGECIEYAFLKMSPSFSDDM